MGRRSGEKGEPVGLVVMEICGFPFQIIPAGGGGGVGGMEFSCSWMAHEVLKLAGRGTGAPPVTSSRMTLAWICFMRARDDFCFAVPNRVVAKEATVNFTSECAEASN